MNTDLIEIFKANIGYFSKFYFGETYKKVDSIYPRCPVFDQHVANYLAWLLTFKTTKVSIDSSEIAILHILVHKVKLIEDLSGKLVEIHNGYKLPNKSTIKLDDADNSDIAIINI
jgi:hypothetical protein